MVQGWWIPTDEKAGGRKSFTLNVHGSGTWSWEKKIDKQYWLNTISQTFQEKKTYFGGLDIGYKYP